MIEDKFEIIIPTKSINHLCLTAIRKIREIYPVVQITIVTDRLSDDLEDFQNVKVIKTNSTDTISKKRNSAVEKSNKTYIAFLDSDAYPHINWLEDAIEKFQEYRDLGVIGGPNIFYENDDRESYFSYLATKSFLLGGQNYQVNNNQIVNVKYVASSNMIVRRDVYTQLQGMNPELTTGEDIDFCIRTHQYQYRVIYSDKCRVSHLTRNFSGFIKQRFVWGIGVIKVLKNTFPYYLGSIVPAMIIVLTLTLLLLGMFAPLLILTLLYLSLCVYETKRTTSNAYEFYKVFKYIFTSIPLIGLGTCANIFIKDNYKIMRFYNNEK